MIRVQWLRMPGRWFIDKKRTWSWVERIHFSFIFRVQDFYADELFGITDSFISSFFLLSLRFSSLALLELLVHKVYNGAWGADANEYERGFRWVRSRNNGSFDFHAWHCYTKRQKNQHRSIDRPLQDTTTQFLGVFIPTKTHFSFLFFSLFSGGKKVKWLCSSEFETKYSKVFWNVTDYLSSGDNNFSTARKYILGVFQLFGWNILGGFGVCIVWELLTDFSLRKWLSGTKIE